MNEKYKIFNFNQLSNIQINFKDQFFNIFPTFSNQLERAEGGANVAPAGGTAEALRVQTLLPRQLGQAVQSSRQSVALVQRRVQQF